MPVRSICLIYLFLSLSLLGFTQSSKYQFSHLDVSNGLSHNQVNCFLKDSKSFIWVGTMVGLNRFDGYTFKNFKHDSKNPHSLIDNYIVNISEAPDQKLWINTRSGLTVYNPVLEEFEEIKPQLEKYHIPEGKTIEKVYSDRLGSYWFLTVGSGVFHYSSNSQLTVHYDHHAVKTLQLISDSVTDLSRDTYGNIWLVYANGEIEKIDKSTNKITYKTSLLKNAGQGKNRIYSILIDKENEIWLYSTNCTQGAYCINPGKNSILHYQKDSGITRLNSNIINNIIQDEEGKIWIATDHGGINVIDKTSQRITYLMNREDDNKSLKQNSVILYKDNLGIIWAGTFKEGISYYHKNIIKFPLYRHYASDSKSMKSEDIDKFAEDNAGNLWVGTNGGGLIYFNRKTGNFTQYKHHDDDKNSLSNDIIVSLLIDRNKKLWIGTYFGGLDCFDGKIFHHFRHSDSNEKSISDDRIWDIFESSTGKLFIGTFAGGLNVLDPGKMVFTHPYSIQEIRSPYISKIIEDRNLNQWVAGYLGVDEIKAGSAAIIHYAHDENNANSLVSNNVNTLLADSRGLIWIGTRDGMSIFNEKTGKFRTLRKENGLSDDVILHILEDNNHTIWVSTSSGLTNIHLTASNTGFALRFKNYTEKDGLQGRGFNGNAGFKTREGELIFGGPHGFNLFDPAVINSTIDRPVLLFTGFSLFNKPINANQPVDGHTILSKSITETKSIVLHHDENVFTIEFAALNFFDADKMKHQYMMEGFDKDWTTVENTNRSATYTNLDAGDYVFKVRAFSSDKYTNPEMIRLKIKILPPVWKSNFAYGFYAFSFIGFLFYSRRRGIYRLKREFAEEQQKLEAERALDQERSEVKRMHDLDLMKIKFLTNVSHEFRTPLSLIMAPVDKMLKGATDDDQKVQINMIKTNARRLLNLVNQLLDFRKMEVQELKLHRSSGDFVAFVREVSTSFTDIAEKKNVTFLFDTEIDVLQSSFDHDKIERILFNLLSNAFKFTPGGGHVSVLLNLDLIKSTQISKLVEIKIIDTGIGIAPEFLEKIFDRFFQNKINGILLNQGSGIGLSITREFVKMHDGTISVESETGQGSCFTVQMALPVMPVIAPRFLFSDSDALLIEKPGDDSDIISKSGILAPQCIKNKRTTVLIAEDNDDFRFYLKDNLKDNFTIIEACNGKDGWQKALALHPDLVVSDISMPVMDGIDLCKKIKNDKRTCHIPVILLTALVGEEAHVKGLEIGASDYLIKPCNFEILLSKIKNLLALQETFKKTYKKQLNVQFDELVVASTDEKFLRTVVEHIQKNIQHTGLTVEELSRHMNMSRVSLYKKVLTLTGRSPVEFIRFIRLQKAAQLLEKSLLNINTICYEVGFNNPAYFTKMFREEFKILPSEYTFLYRKKEEVKLK